MSELAKFTPPRLTRVYRRIGLFDRFDAALAHPVAWLSGLPGAGKTTALASYVDARGRRALWYQVDPGDGDLATFFYFLRMAAFPDPSLAPTFGLEHAAAPERFGRDFIRALFAQRAGPRMLVLDNYQELPATSALHRVLAAALEEVPADAAAVVVSRGEPPPAFARLRVRGAMAVVPAEAFALDARDAAGIARTWHADASDADIQRLREQSGGWAAAIVLGLEGKPAARTAPPLASGGDASLIFDFFAGEVLDHLAPEHRHVLLATAVPPNVSRRVAERLAGPDAWPFLEDLARRGLFTTLHGVPEPVCQYHPLFREFLLARGAHSLGGERLRALRLEAGHLLAADGDDEAAAALLAAAGDADALVALVLSRAPALAATARGEALARWISLLPADRRDRDAWLLHWDGVARFGREPLAARRLMEAAHARALETNDAAAAFATWTALVRMCTFDWGEMVSLDRWIDGFAELRQRFTAPPPGPLEVTTASAWFAALSLRAPDHPDMPAALARAEAILASDAEAGVRADLLVPFVEFLIWRGEFRRAARHVDAIPAMFDLARLGPLRRMALLSIEGGVAWSVGDRDRCLRAVRDGLDEVERSGIRMFELLFAGHGVMGHLLHDEFEPAERFARRMRAAVNPALAMQAAFARHAEATLALRRGDARRSLEDGLTSVAEADRCGVIVARVHTRIATSAAASAAGRHSEAVTLLEEARRLGARLGGTYIEHAHATQDALRALRARDMGAVREALGRAMPLGVDSAVVNHPWAMSAELAQLCALAIAWGIEPDHTRDVIRARALAAPELARDLEGWPWRVRIRALGGLELQVDGARVDFEGETGVLARELLARIVAVGGDRAGEESLTEGAGPRSAFRRGFEAAVETLRGIVGADALLREAGTISLSPRCCFADAAALERILGRACTSLERGALADGPDDAPALAGRASALNRGELLAGFEEPWAERGRRRLRERVAARLQSLRALAERSDRADVLAVLALTPEHPGLPEASLDRDRALAAAAERWGLTARQAEVLGLLALGLANREIGRRLGCAESTVELHVTAILNKSGCDSRTAVVSALLQPATGRSRTS